MADHTIAVPVRIRLQAVKVENLCALGPGRGVLQIIRDKIISVVREHGDRFSVFQREGIHDQLIRIAVNELVGLRAFQIFEVVPDFCLAEFKSRSLNREDAGVEPPRARLYGFCYTEEIGLRAGRKPERTPLELTAIDQSDSRDKQRTEI